LTDDNAFRRFWALGFRSLVPIIPPGAPISERSTLFKRIGTKQDGRGKTPGTRGRDGLWSSFPWADYVADEIDLSRWSDMGAGVGIRTGELIGIDADTMNPEMAVVIRDAIEARFGRLPVRVGRSPKALYVLRLSEPMPYARIEFGDERVEVLTDGKQFVAEGVHPVIGKPYTWPRGVPAYANIPIASPADVSALLEDLREKLPQASRVIVEGGGADTSQASLAAPLEVVRRAVAAIPNTSNHFPSRESYVQLGYAIKAALPDDEPAAFDLFSEWCGRWTDGTNEPDVIEADWRRMKPPFKRGASWLVELAAERSDTLAWFEPIADAPENLFPVDEPSESDSRPPLRAGRITLDDLANLPPREWLYGNKVLRKYVTFVASPGGVGKTAFVFALALACAAKRALLHDEPRGRRPLRVWIFNLEDDIIELRRRMVAAVQHYGLPADTLDNIRINSGRDRGFKIVKLGQNGGYVVQPDYEQLIAEIQREQIDIAIFDPFLRTHGVPENENEAQDEVMRLFAQVAETTACGIVLVHHTKKGAIAGDMDSLRGGSTQGGSARAAFTLSPMQVEEAARLGIPEAERRLYVRVDDAKNNMAPPIAKAEWLRLVGYKLGNSTDDYPSGDSVQVVTKWTPPDAWDGILGAGEESILSRLGAGMENGERYSMRAQDTDRWAGTMMVDEFDRSPAQAKQILDAWQKEGRIVVKDYVSEKQRKSRRGIYLTSTTGTASGSVFD
jgi:hypothetical protein